MSCQEKLVSCQIKISPSEEKTIRDKRIVFLYFKYDELEKLSWVLCPRLSMRLSSDQLNVGRFDEAVAILTTTL